MQGPGWSTVAGPCESPAKCRIVFRLFCLVELRASEDWMQLSSREAAKYRAEQQQQHTVCKAAAAAAQGAMQQSSGESRKMKLGRVNFNSAPEQLKDFF